MRGVLQTVVGDPCQVWVPHMPLLVGPYQQGQALVAFVGVPWWALVDWLLVLLCHSRRSLLAELLHHELLHNPHLQAQDTFLLFNCAMTTV